MSACRRRVQAPPLWPKESLDPYSRRTPQGYSAIGMPYLYTGQRLDAESSLYYYKNRPYDSISGRFLARDPIGYRDGPNSYLYAHSSPERNTDPLGLASPEYQKTLMLDKECPHCQNRQEKLATDNRCHGAVPSSFGNCGEYQDYLANKVNGQGSGFIDFYEAQDAVDAGLLQRHAGWAFDEFWLTSDELKAEGAQWNNKSGQWEMNGQPVSPRGQDVHSVNVYTSAVTGARLGVGPESALPCTECDLLQWYLLGGGKGLFGTLLNPKAALKNLLLRPALKTIAGRSLDDILKDESIFKRWVKSSHDPDKPHTVEEATKIWNSAEELGMNPRLDPPSTRGTFWTDVTHINIGSAHIPVDSSFKPPAD
jgi:RHS repeat-associated protein